MGWGRKRFFLLGMPEKVGGKKWSPEDKYVD